MGKILYGVIENTSLKSITFSNNALMIFAAGGDSIGRVLRESQTLEVLGLIQNQTSDEGIGGIADGIAKSRFLKQISLRSCCLSLRDHSGPGVQQP